MALRRARLLADVGIVEFAELLRSRLDDEDVPTPATVSAWEDGVGVPTAVVLLVAAEVAQVELEVLFARRPVLVRLDQLEERIQRQSRALHELLQRVS
jgi:hypothetical protein